MVRPLRDVNNVGDIDVWLESSLQENFAHVFCTLMALVFDGTLSVCSDNLPDKVLILVRCLDIHWNMKFVYRGVKIILREVKVSTLSCPAGILIGYLISDVPCMSVDMED